MCLTFNMKKIKASPDTSINFAGIKCKNPVFVASGTFGYGYEAADLTDINSIGAIITKTITLSPKAGNPPPRLAEVTSGILNSIGLQNVGVAAFCRDKLPLLQKLKTPVIVSIAGETAADYAAVARALNGKNGIAAIELNLSCPNLKKQIICQNAQLVNQIISRVKKACYYPVIAKLSPQVADIGALGILAESSGADALSVANTFPGMAINVNTFRPKISTVTGGMSGPAIKPLALRCVWETARRVRIPVLGGGGIATGSDAIEFILAGARAVSAGTANFIDPQAPATIAAEIAEYMKKKNISSLSDITGKVMV